jgi:hypothetical protein
VIVSEHTLAEMRDTEPQDMWQRRSPPQSEGEVQSHMKRGSARAHLSRKARSRAIGHVVLLLILIGRSLYAVVPSH